MKNHLDKLPPAMVYSEYLKKVVSEFQISENEARQKFGSFTLKQWSELFYNLKKEKARQIAIDIQSKLSNEKTSYSELIEIQNRLQKIGKRTGLIKEFRENGIL